MHISIRDIRSIERADIDLTGQLTLITGINHQGKSTILNATGLALTGQFLPKGLKKSDAGRYVRDGAAGGAVRISDQNFALSVTYPKVDAESQGPAPYVSAFAAGLTSLVDLKDDDLAKVLADYLKTAPTKDDVELAMKDIGLNEKAVTVMWAELEKTGWDAVHTRAVDYGKKLKGAWEHIVGSGQKYGSKLAETYLPQAWDDSLTGASLDALDAAVTAARQGVEAQVGNEAVASDERKKLQARAEGLAAAGDDLAQMREDEKAAQDALEAAKEVRAALPESVEGGAGIACPHCQQRVKVSTVKGVITLSKIEAPNYSDEEKKSLRMAIASADGKLGSAQSALSEAQRNTKAAAEAVDIAEDAVRQLTAMGDATTDAGAQSKLAAARETLRLAEVRRDAFKQKTDADAKHRAIRQNQQVIDMLAPDGLRKRKLTREIDTFNARLAGLCTEARWGTVSLAPDLTIAYAGRPYALLADSEKWIVRTVLQVAMAQIDGSKLLLIDGADILYENYRNGLVKMLLAVKIHAAIGMTVSALFRAPDFAGAKIGETFWVEDGTATPLSLRREAA